MLTYRAHPAVTKRFFVAEMEAHAAADQLISGSYGGMKNGKFVGCAVGCGIHAINKVMSRDFDPGDHASLSEALGWPLWLVRVEDRIFEGLPADRRSSWPTQLAEAVPDGSNLDGVMEAWLARMLRTLVLPVAGSSAAVVERVARGLETGWQDDDATAAQAAEAAAAAQVAQAAWAADEIFGNAYVAIADILLDELRRAPVAEPSNG